MDGSIRQLGLPLNDCFRGGAAAYVAAHQEKHKQLPGDGIAALDAQRAAALEQLARQGLPSQRDEDWKYTSIRSITKSAFALAEPAAIARLPLSNSTRSPVWMPGA